MPYGKSIELFLVNGTADSLTTAELSNWNGKAIKIPRIEVPGCMREDIQQPGVYFLFCKEDDNSDAVYIGEAENVRERLLQHIRDYQADKEAYYWNTAVIFTGRDLNKALIRYLENGFVQTVRKNNRCKVLTKSTFQNTVLKESHIAAMDEFSDNVKILMGALGYRLLEPLVQSDSEADAPQNPLLYLTSGNASARGRVTTEGFVMLKGSTVSSRDNAPSLSPGMAALRTSLMNSSKVINHCTAEDILFTSSSAAADFALGFSASGPAYWKTADGTTLKQLEAAATSED